MAARICRTAVARMFFGRVRRLVGQLDLVADCLLARPELMRGRFVDNDDAGVLATSSRRTRAPPAPGCSSS